jgi:hypothetical protein
MTRVKAQGPAEPDARGHRLAAPEHRLPQPKMDPPVRERHAACTRFLAGAALACMAAACAQAADLLPVQGPAAPPPPRLALGAAGGRQLIVVDAGSPERRAIVQLPNALEREPVTAPDGRAAYVAMRDGWIGRIDLAGAAMTQVRAGERVGALALSSDGRWLLAAVESPRALVAYAAADLAVAKTLPTVDLRGRPGRVSAVYDAPPRASFVVAFDDIAEAWELPYGPDAAPVYEGLVHDYRLGEGVAARGPFPVRRIPLDVPLRAFAFEPGFDYGVAAVPGTTLLRVVNLNVRRKIADIPLPAVPAPEISAAWVRDGVTMLGMARRDGAGVEVIDTKRWAMAGTIATAGRARFIAAHPAVPNVFIGTEAGDAGRSPGGVQVFDRSTLLPAGAVQPESARPIAAARFAVGGRRLLLLADGEPATLLDVDATTPGAPSPAATR